MPATGRTSPAADETEEGPASVVHRACAILDAFEGDVRSLGLSELARRAGLPKATVHRLALDLVACRLLDRDGTSFRLGVHLFELGQRVAPHRTLRETAVPYMADLREATHQTVNLGVLEGGYVVYIESLKVLDAPAILNLARSGGRMPAHATGLGKALLAWSPPEVVTAVLSGPLERMSSRTIVDPQRLAATLGTVRQSGVAYDLEESASGLVCAASPVFGPGGRLVAALSVSGRSHQVVLDHVTSAVRTSALAISRAMGASPSAGREGGRSRAN